MHERFVPPAMSTGELAVHIVSEGGTQDHVLLLAHDASGVHMREWHSGNWATGADESVVTGAALLARLEGVVRNRQRIEPDLSVVRAWLAAPPR
jgi:hypothetical protein